MRLCLVLLCLTFSLSAQETPPVVRELPLFFPLIRTYFSLTQEQERGILDRMTAFTRYQAQKLQRQGQVNLELTQEYQRQPLDPMALGLRYVEISTIQRELTEEQARVTKDMQALLTTQQRQRLTALEEAGKLQATICEAQQLGLLSPQPFPASTLGGVISPNPWFDTNQFAVPGLSRVSSGCSSSFGIANFILGLPSRTTTSPVQ